jgi:hypothetical protein
MIALIAKPYLLGDVFPMKTMYAACKSLYADFEGISTKLHELTIIIILLLS